MDRTQQPPAPGTRLVGARPPVGTAVLLGIEGIAFLGLWIAGEQAGGLVRQLVIAPSEILRQPWRLVTAPLVHVGLLGALLDLISIWIFGAALELGRGTRRMIAVFAGAQIAGGIAAALVGRVAAPMTPIAGCGAGIVGLIAALGVAWGGARVALFGAIEMKARTMAIALVALSLAPPLARGDWVQLGALSTGALVGGALAAGLGARLHAELEEHRMRRLRKRYRVIPGGRDRRGYVH